MPYKKYFGLQLFAEDGGAADAMSVSGDAAATAENSGFDGVATGEPEEQAAPAPGDETGESWDSLINGRFKKDYERAVKAAVGKRLRNQQNLQSRLDQLNPVLSEIAARYGIAPDQTGQIPIQALNEAVMNDKSAYEAEAFEKGMAIDDLMHMKSLERENARLRASSEQAVQQQRWNAVVSEGEQLKQIYPDFDLDAELENEQFGRLLATLQRSGFPNPVKTAYESTHSQELLANGIGYAVNRTASRMSKAIQSGMNRPAENGTQGRPAATAAGIDPSKLTKADFENIRRRAAAGERIVF